MFIGEGPGFHENEQGRPFVGASGQFLEQLLAQAGLKRSDVWIGNVVKCRPPDNRDPLPAELAACDVYLERQINAINPSIIVTLGRFSMGKFMPGAKISAVHGQMRKIGNRYVIPMFHPAAALHQAALKPAILADFAKLPELLEDARLGLGKSAPAPKLQEAPTEEPKQLKLF
jgi:DNA polymerase